MPNTLRLPYAATGAFSQVVAHYLDADPKLTPFYRYSTDKAGIASAIADRRSAYINREVLLSTLTAQYASLPHNDKVAANIERLKDANTFTVCTAHQPNLCTGYLYFVYKILHAIKLADDLNKDFPESHFVPVYYIGSEDADLDELGTFRYGHKKFVWDADGQKGAVGGMKTASLKPLLDELFSIMGPPGENLDHLKELLANAYLHHDTIATATQHLVHSLFGHYGLVVLNPDDSNLKRAFIPVMEDDLLNHTAEGFAQSMMDRLTEAGYKPQAFPRSINLFYLKGNIRERIEQVEDNKWQVVNTALTFSKDALLQELHEYPERFSPNVILRPLYQETILPNVAFIGGGAEVAYWLQLKDLFIDHNVYYPVILLRQSFMWIGKKEQQLKEKLGLTIEDLFRDSEQLIATAVVSNAGTSWQTGEEASEAKALIERLKLKAVNIDPTLEKSAESVLTRIERQLQVLQKKMLRAEKKKHQTEIERIIRLKQWLFPSDSLQERIENFMPYYLEHGPQFFDILLNAIESYTYRFVIIEA